MKKKILFRWLKVFIILYCLIGIGLYYGQDSLLFHGKQVPRDTQYQFDTRPFTELNIPYSKTANISIVKFQARPMTDTTHGLVLYFHGNKDGIEHYAHFASDFTSNGYEVWMIDYPGFGKSTGPISEKKLYEYAHLFYKLARSRYAPRDITIYGRSLGTGIAAELASVRDCRRLILESPYYSMNSVARHYFPIYPLGAMLHWHFPTNEFLPQVTAPIIIFHGDSDDLIPLENAQRLKPFLKAGDQFYTIPGAGHNNLHDFPLFRKQLDSVLSSPVQKIGL